jgi:hypothetical protein
LLVRIWFSTTPDFQAQFLSGSPEKDVRFWFPLYGRGIIAAENFILKVREEVFEVLKNYTNKLLV